MLSGFVEERSCAAIGRCERPTKPNRHPGLLQYFGRVRGMTERMQAAYCVELQQYLLFLWHQRARRHSLVAAGSVEAQARCGWPHVVCQRSANRSHCLQAGEFHRHQYAAYQPFDQRWVPHTRGWLGCYSSSSIVSRVLFLFACAFSAVVAAARKPRLLVLRTHPKKIVPWHIYNILIFSDELWQAAWFSLHHLRCASLLQNGSAVWFAPPRDWRSAIAACPRIERRRQLFKNSLMFSPLTISPVAWRTFVVLTTVVPACMYIQMRRFISFFFFSRGPADTCTFLAGAAFSTAGRPATLVRFLASFFLACFYLPGGEKQSATWRKEDHRARRNAPRSARSTRTRIPRATAGKRTSWRAPSSVRPPKSSRRESECAPFAAASFLSAGGCCRRGKKAAAEKGELHSAGFLFCSGSPKHVSPYFENDFKNGFVAGNTTSPFSRCPFRGNDLPKLLLPKHTKGGGVRRANCVRSCFAWPP